MPEGGHKICRGSQLEGDSISSLGRLVAAVDDSRQTGVSANTASGWGKLVTAVDDSKQTGINLPAERGRVSENLP